MPQINQTLLSLGFSENEIKTYTASLQNGPRDALELAELSGLPKLTAHVAIDALLKRGLMTSFDREDKRYFSAEHPDKLLGYVERTIDKMKEQVEDLKNQLPELEGQMSDEKPTVKFYEGKAGLQTILDERIEMGAKDVKVFSSLDRVMDLFSREDVYAYRKKRTDNEVKYYCLYSTSKYKDHPPSPNATQILIDEEKFPFFSDVAVYDDKVSICSLSGHRSGVIIQGQEIADTFRTIFFLASEGAKKLQ